MNTEDKLMIMAISIRASVRNYVCSEGNGLVYFYKRGEYNPRFSVLSDVNKRGTLITIFVYEREYISDIRAVINLSRKNIGNATILYKFERKYHSEK